MHYNLSDFRLGGLRMVVIGILGVKYRYEKFKSHGIPANLPDTRTEWLIVGATIVSQLLLINK